MAGFLLLFAACLYASPARAHKLKVFVFAEAATLHGNAYFVGGSPAIDVRISVFAPSGAVLAETRTDREGRFSVVARQRINHRVVADNDDGHQAEFIVRESELPPSLPVVSATAEENFSSSLSSTPVNVAVSSANGASSAFSGEIVALVDAAVARQVGPLREQLDRFADVAQMRDVLGGIGYILGVTGLVLWFRCRR